MRVVAGADLSAAVRTLLSMGGREEYRSPPHNWNAYVARYSNYEASDRERGKRFGSTFDSSLAEDLDLPPVPGARSRGPWVLHHFDVIVGADKTLMALLLGAAEHKSEPTLHQLALSNGRFQ
jgi:hypothetical protein